MNSFSLKKQVLAFLMFMTLPTSFCLANPDLVPSQKSLDFGIVPIGSKLKLHITIFNNGDTPIESINYVTNCDVYNFLVESDCLEDLMPHKTCSLDITFKPRELYSFECAAQIQSNKGHIYIPIKGVAAKP